MFKRSLLSLVLIAGLACPLVARAEGEEAVVTLTEQVCNFVKDNQVAFGAATVTVTAAAVAALAWYYGYFQTAENNEAEDNQVA